MNKVNLLLVSFLSFPVFSQSINIPISNSVSEPFDIENTPGVYIDSNQTRNSDALEQEIQWRSKILQPESLSAHKNIAEGNQSSEQRTGCPVLPLDNAIYTNLQQEGDVQCYSVEIKETTKIQGVLTNIAEDVDYNLYLFQLTDENKLATLDTSVSSTARQEQVFYKAEPGIYVLAVEAKTGISKEKAIVGWLSHPEYDAQETNDKASQAYTLTSSATIQGNMDNNNDLDYYVYKTGADQNRIALKFSASDQFITELWTGSQWAAIPHNQVLAINDVSSNSSVYFLVRANTESVPATSAQYSLTVSDPDSGVTLSNVNVWNTEKLAKHDTYRNTLEGNCVVERLKKIRHCFPLSKIFAHNKLEMSGTVLDQQGLPVPYANVLLYARDGVNDLLGEPTVVTTDEQGKFMKTVKVADCSGKVDQKRLEQIGNGVSYGTLDWPELWWDIEFEERYSEYTLAVTAPNSPQGIEQKQFIHLCNATLRKMCYHLWDHNAGKEINRCTTL
ncbi:carboxypeptidase-like regulatory domain-containing protein [Vibrio gazogenes]|uniref:Carboxypeptidase regulatory-like domain-containing protein n=1 Tax=Vibrio gazogenes DSM 21264 = NBRC 103151 TaxID=1123492 RepID=A0A1M4UWM3_VIBGA|nr:carboxypeptidase-like regulatory domain-containing protein [Vibrio gazogenes]USP15660.1 carboxypeptidase-like regulatory domain-containing protein [Vibrio gazogenes]SHE61141.1 hypothetical protein SAMN02745781_00583 [Vibrio gazogenes DSM 21264] [Vibrio gazogenes DSM 21264 = NBRC 103151]SJN56106.1 hypothetical protein BQ6471_01882 [Vibrio gazogenes]